MKKFFATVSVLLLSCAFANAQKVGYVNTENILSSIDQYNSATEQLDALADKYKAVIESEIGKIDQMYRTYQANKEHYTASQRQQKEDEIITRERAVKEKQQAYFGEDGVMQKKTSEMLDPIKDRVQDAIDKVALEGDYVMVVDIAATTGLVFINDKYNLDREVIDKLKK